MSGSACGPDCGYCHGCTSEYEREDSTPVAFRCAECGYPIDRVSIAVPTTPNHAVSCCSTVCAQQLTAKLAADR